jgi:hypothetical protein
LLETWLDKIHWLILGHRLKKNKAKMIKKKNFLFIIYQDRQEFVFDHRIDFSHKPYLRELSVLEVFQEFELDLLDV